MAQVASTQVITSAVASAARTYLSCSDLFLRQTWCACALGYTYQLDPVVLGKAAQALAEAFPELAGRLQRDRLGSYFIDASNTGFTLTSAQALGLQLNDILPAFALHDCNEAVPINRLADHFIEQMQPDCILNGTDALLSLRLTAVQDGMVLGISFSHLLADTESMGQVMCRLANLYQKPSITSTQGTTAEGRLLLQRIGRTYSKASTRLESEAELIASLPRYMVAPTSFNEWVGLGVYDVFGSSAQERGAGSIVTHQVLHVPGTSSKSLHDQILESNAARQAEITTLTAHDVMGALLWILRELAAGNDFSTALRMPFNYVVDLRRLQAADPAYRVPANHFGNSVTVQIIQPPQLPSLESLTSTDASCTSSTSQGPPQQHKSTMQPRSADASSTSKSHAEIQQGRLQDALIAAACAIHKGTQALQSDPLVGAKGLAGMLGRVGLDYWQGVQASPGFNPLRDGASLMSSWRKSSIERPDFGQGPPFVIAAKTLPLKHKMAFLTSGPGGDGVLCFTGFRASEFRKIQSSNVLQHLAPGATFIKPAISNAS